MASEAQVIGLARGIEQNGRPSRASTERALAIAAFVNEHLEVDVVDFSGNVSFTYDGPEIPSTEADGMLAEAVNAGMRIYDLDIRVDSKSDDTMSSFINGSRYFLAHGKRTYVAAHSDHMSRALWSGRYVMPDTEFVPLVVEGHVDRRSVVQDKLFHAAYISKFMMDRVPRGDVDAIEEANDEIQQAYLLRREQFRALLGRDDPQRLFYLESQRTPGLARRFMPRR